jgi:hypothetical protein
MIPKVIWTFWDTEELPEFIEKCIETWKFHNSDYEIIVMNMSNYNNYTDIDVTKLRHYSKWKPQLTADYIRLSVLKEHGGVWMDASIICIKPLKFEESTEFFVYYKDNYGLLGNYKYPLIESWFIASSKHNLFIEEWFRELLNETEKYSSMDFYAWSSDVKIKLYYFVGYFAIHIAAQKVLKKLDRENKLPKMVLKHATIDGPMSFSHIFIGDSLCNTSFNDLKTPIIKLDKTSRLIIKLNKSIYECILKKIEHFGSEKYVEDMGYNNLNGNFQIQDEGEYRKRIIILVVLVFILLSILIILKNMLK